MGTIIENKVHDNIENSKNVILIVVVLINVNFQNAKKKYFIMFQACYVPINNKIEHILIPVVGKFTTQPTLININKLTSIYRIFCD